MKRKKQIVRNVILVALTALLFLWQGGYHLTPERVFRSAEKAEWLGTCGRGHGNWELG